MKKTEPQSELLVYKASAGSGKTFTLAVEYIKLLILNPYAYRQILAVTFTNKATAEMKERILSQLFGIHTGDKDSQAYLNRIVEETGKTEEEVRQAAGIALRYMLHDYSRFRIETIDSFFQSVMRNLARELELSPNLNIILDKDEVLSEAVDKMIEKLTLNSPTLTWLLNYINEYIANDKRWNVSDNIKSFSKYIFDEVYIEQGEKLRQQLAENPHIIQDYRKTLKSLEDDILTAAQGFYNEFERLLSSKQLSANDLKNGSRGIGSYFNKLNNGKLSNDIRNATVEKCLQSAKEWSSNQSGNKQTIIDLAQEHLIPLLIHAEEKRKTYNLLLNGCRLSLQHLNNLQLLNQVDQEVRLQNHTHNRFLLSDTNALLHQLVKDGDSSFVFEKIGTNIRNVMIDEFQDTSRMQWGNFKLLLLEGLAHGANSLIVGDVKQSIYRWRNGDWGILNGLNDRIEHFPVRVKTLTVNRRSEANIIQFNNLIFTETTRFFNERYKAEFSQNDASHTETVQDCAALAKAYADVVQQSPREVKKGYVKVSFLENKKNKDYIQQTLVRMGQEVERLLASGVQLNDIAILVRKNKRIPIIADYFDKQLHYKIVSNEAFYLKSSSAICLMIDALRYLSDESNLIARTQLAIAYQKEVLQNEADWNTLLLQPVDSFLPKEFLERENELRLMPLYELLEKLFVIFDLKKIQNQDAYLFAFFDAVTEYLQNNSSELAAFIRYWDDKMGLKTIPSGEVEGIRIFSIHKSKGLEFHTVLIPFCDWVLEEEKNGKIVQMVWCKPPITPFNQLDLLPISYSSAMAESIYVNDFLQEQLQLWVDNLNLLYVAFTRAGKNLIMWTKEGEKGTMSELLSQVIPTIALKTESKWEEGTYEFGEICPTETKDEKLVTNKLLQHPLKHPVQMESLRQTIEFKQSNRSNDFILGVEEEESDNRFINRGQMLHTLFSAIETKNDIDKAIDRLIFEGVIREEEKETMVNEVIEKAFSMPEIQDWYSGEWTLFNECAILYQENGKMEIRRPDRVMMKNGEAIVVDFKFGKPNRKYPKQVKEYIQLLTRMGYKQISGYLWYVDEEKIEKVK